jgi:hypothetical protein
VRTSTKLIKGGWIKAYQSKTYQSFFGSKTKLTKALNQLKRKMSQFQTVDRSTHPGCRARPTGHSRPQHVITVSIRRAENFIPVSCQRSERSTVSPLPSVRAGQLCPLYAHYSARCIVTDASKACRQFQAHATQAGAFSAG